VALAIATTMIFGIVYYVKLAPVYPEYNRANTYIADRAIYKKESQDIRNSSRLSFKAINDLFKPLKNCVAVSAEGYYDGDGVVLTADDSDEFETTVRLVDPEFFKIYNYRFIEGAPLSDADLASGLHNAVITRRLAMRVFGTESDFIGRTFTLDNTEWRVAGVIEDPSALTADAYSQIFAPYTARSNYDYSWALEYMGSYTVRILTDGDDQAKAMRDELHDAVRRYNASFPGGPLDGWTFSIEGSPKSYYESVFNRYNAVFSWKKLILNYGIVLMVLLMVPALNLSGIIAGRMESRLPEIGVRQSFGATRRRLLGLVLCENLVLTCAGGIAGLIMAWIGISAGKDWIFTLFEKYPEINTDTSANILTTDMLFAPGIFIAAFAICLILNLLAALIPAWWALRHPITESLNQKK